MIDISVYILTYYHEDYLEKAIESVLSQKTKYNYEIVISDDNSQDKTREIIQYYVEKYPDIVKANYNKTNIGIPKNIFIARTMCKGRYIVDLAGDDYWIDDKKLEKQASFLDNNPDYDIVCTRFETRYENEDKTIGVYPSISNVNKDFTIDDYKCGGYLQTRGMMMKNFFLDEKSKEYFCQAIEFSEKIDDAVDEILFLNRYKIYMLPDVTDVYRIMRSKDNKFNYNSKYSYLEQMKNSIEMYNRLNEKFGDKIDFCNRYSVKVAELILMGLLTREFREFYKIYKTIPSNIHNKNKTTILLKSFSKIYEIIIDRIGNIFK